MVFFGFRSYRTVKYVKLSAIVQASIALFSFSIPIILTFSLPSTAHLPTVKNYPGVVTLILLLLLYLCPILSFLLFKKKYKKSLLDSTFTQKIVHFSLAVIVIVMTIFLMGIELRILLSLQDSKKYQFGKWEYSELNPTKQEQTQEEKTTKNDPISCRPFSEFGLLQKNSDGSTSFESKFGYPFYDAQIKGTLEKDVELSTCFVSDVRRLLFKGVGFELAVSPLHVNHIIPYYTVEYVGKMSNTYDTWRIQTLYNGQQKLENEPYQWNYVTSVLADKDGCFSQEEYIRPPCGEVNFSIKDAGNADDEFIYVIECKSEDEDAAKRCDAIVLDLDITNQ
jgi:hypothetical protein